MAQLTAFPVAQPLQASLAAHPATTPPRLREGWDVGQLMVMAKKLLQEKAASLGVRLGFQPSPVPTPLMFVKRKAFSRWSSLHPWAAVFHLADSNV